MMKLLDFLCAATAAYAAVGAYAKSPEWAAVLLVWAVVNLIDYAKRD